MKAITEKQQGQVSGGFFSVSRYLTGFYARPQPRITVSPSPALPQPFPVPTHPNVPGTPGGGADDFIPSEAH